MLIALILLAACGGGGTDTADSPGAGSADGTEAASAEGEGESQTARLAILTGEGHPYLAGAETFKERVEDLTGGDITIDIFPDAQLGGEADYLDLVRSGGVEFGEFVMSIPASTLGHEELQAMALPFLYEDAESMHRAWDSEAVQDALTVFEDDGFRCIGLWDTGFRQLTSNRPIESVADLEGLNIRVPEGELYVDTWETLGATPTAMAIPELYSALETGIVDATDIPFVAIVSLKYHEVQSHAAETRYMDDPVCFAVSNQFFDSLSDDQRQAVLEAGQASSEAARQAAVESEEASVQELQDLGLTFTEPDLAEFRDAVEPVYERFFQSAGEEARTLVEEIRSAMEQE